MDLPRQHWLLMVAGGVLAVVVIAWLWRNADPGDPGGPRQQWFYDLQTRERFAMPMGTSPPVAAPSDVRGERNGVLAVVVKTASGPQIAYLVTGDRPGRPPAVATPPPSGPSALVRHPDGGEWIPESSPAAAPILARAQELNGAGPLRLDFPTD